MKATFNLVRGIVALVALSILIGTVVLNPLLTGWIGGYAANEKMQSVGVKAAQEAAYRTLCPEYLNASYFERWTNPRIFGNGWCEEYKDRL